MLALLQREGRISTVELAERLRLSPTATGERLKRLTRDGVIQGYRAQLDPVRLDLGLLVFVEISLDKTSADIFDRFAQAVRRAPEVLECHMVAGGFDYLLKARIPDMPAYRRFLGDVLLALPGVTETRTYAVMEEVKQDAPLPV
jgi:Lrp/AsnC family leucine-responsive transcriptional regulator